MLCPQARERKKNHVVSVFIYIRSTCVGQHRYPRASKGFCTESELSENGWPNWPCTYLEQIDFSLGIYFRRFCINEKSAIKVHTSFIRIACKPVNPFAFW